MNATITKEPFSMDLFAEILPLAKACWKESTEAKADTCAFYGERDFDIDPYADMYLQMQELGILIVVTLRESGKLVGYMAAAFYQSMHHKKFRCCNVDSLYIEPSHRSSSKSLINFFEKEMAESGVAIIGWPTIVGTPLYELLKALGYVGDEMVMEKRICA